MGSATIYADDYVPSSASTSSATSTMIRGQAQHPSKAASTPTNNNNNNKNRLNQSSDSKCVQSSKTSHNGFNDRLKRLYRTLNKTLNISSHLIGSATTREVDRTVEKKLEHEDDDVETLASKTSVTMDKSAATSRCMNEYSSVSGGGGVVAECELKTENDSIVPSTPVSGLSDRLRLFRPNTPLGMRRLINSNSSSSAGENTYVASTPIQVSSGFVSGSGARGDSTLTAESPGQLNIYEVDFDNNVAYIVPSVTTVPSSCSVKSGAVECKDDAEIYHVGN